jgi:hypothetical protein
MGFHKDWFIEVVLYIRQKIAIAHTDGDQNLWCPTKTFCENCILLYFMQINNGMANLQEMLCYTFIS